MIQFGWGELQLAVLDAGPLWLDGGAMFGIVPKPLWQRERAADERNRIQLGLNLLLVDDGRERTLIDTGVGPRWDEHGRAIYGLEPRTAAEVLAPAGLAPSDIDRVINSHLHFDHAGGNIEPDTAGELVAAFPRAEYVVQRGELDTARWRNERTRGSYRADDFEPLAREGRLRLVDGDVDLAPHLKLRLAPGHTPHMQVVEVVSSRGTVGFLADLVPTASHVRSTYIMSYDLEPLRTLDTKKRLLARALAESWWLIFEHDPGLPLGRLAEEGGRLVARPIEGDS